MNKWQETKLSEIGNVISGGTPSTGIAAFWNGEIPFVTPFDLSRNHSAYVQNTERKISKEGLLNSSANLLPVGSIVISSRAPIGYIAIAKEELVTNQGCKSIVPNSDFAPLYLYYCLDFYMDRIKRLGAGSTFAEISKSDLESVKIPHPLDKVEQEKIAKILDSIDTLIQKTQAIIAKYYAIKDGMLHDMFTRGVDVKTGMLRPTYEAAPKLYKKSELGMIPKEWMVEESNKLVRFINGRAYSLHEWESFGTPVIRLQNLTGSGNNFYYSTLKLPDDQYCNYGDLLYMWSASFGPYIWEGPRAIFHYHIWKVECSFKILKDYFYYDLSRFTETVLDGANGSTMAHITKEGMDKRLLKVPSIEEQKLIVAKLKQIDKEIKSEQTYLQKLQQLKSGLMKDLLSGKKKVKLTD